MILRRWRARRPIALILVLAALSATGPSGAATPPQITEAVVFGNLRPGDPSPETDPVLAELKTADTLFANSRPFGRYEHGIAFVRGTATGDLTADGTLLLFVDIVATDGVNEARRTVTVQPVDDPEINKLRGDFQAELDVWELGVHEASGTPDSDDPAVWGGSELTFLITARATDGTTGPTATRTLTKYAGTPRDTFAPALSRLRWPPEHWCHMQARGAQDPFGGGFTFGGGANGQCSDFPDFLPMDPTWVYCTEPLPGFSLRRQTKDPFFGQNESLWANRNSCPARNDDSAGQYAPQGNAIVSGHIDDLVPGAFGIASEIGSVTVQVWQGDTMLRETRNVLRQGAQADFGLTMNINEFEPNALWHVPLGDPYQIRVVACDAWRNCTTAESPEITVHAY